MLRYKCLVLDHDDTAVMSTPSVHYPSFLDSLAHLRPGETISLREYMQLCFDPGFERMCFERFRFTQDDMAWQLENWQRHVERQIPPFWPGMPEVIRRQKAEGGLVCVVSQSYARFVLRDYAAAGLPAPDRALGWELGSARQKPHPDPLYLLMEEFSLSPRDLLVADDLKPGYDMAQAVGSDFAATLWPYAEEPLLRQNVLDKCPGALAADTPEALAKILFE